MNLFGLEVILDYGKKTIIIAIIATIVTMLVKKIFKIKIVLLNTYCALLISIFIEFIYDNIFLYHAFTFSAESLYSGIITGSLSTALEVFFNKILNGKTEYFDNNLFLVEGLLGDKFNEKQKEEIAKIIIKVINENNNKFSENELLKKIQDEINKKLNINLEENLLLEIIIKILSITK